MRRKGERLPRDTRVYRGIRRRWVDRLSGEVLAVAFFLREHEEGLSVSESARNAFYGLKNLAGVAVLGVDEIEDSTDERGSALSLWVEADPQPEGVPPDPLHSEIRGLPPYGEPGTPTFELQNSIADALLRSARPQLLLEAELPDEGRWTGSVN
jgi:hypothetical protein